jgi:hypothetical protein
MRDLIERQEWNIHRPAMSMPIVCAEPHIAEPAAKKIREPSITGRLPKIWANPPDSGRKAVEESA